MRNIISILLLLFFSIPTLGQDVPNKNIEIQISENTKPNLTIAAIDFLNELKKIQDICSQDENKEICKDKKINNSDYPTSTNFKSKKYNDDMGKFFGELSLFYTEVKNFEIIQNEIINTTNSNAEAKLKASKENALALLTSNDTNFSKLLDLINQENNLAGTTSLTDKEKSDIQTNKKLTENNIKDLNNFLGKNLNNFLDKDKNLKKHNPINGEGLNITPEQIQNMTQEELDELNKKLEELNTQVESEIEKAENNLKILDENNKFRQEIEEIEMELKTSKLKQKNLLDELGIDTTNLTIDDGNLDNENQKLINLLNQVEELKKEDKSYTEIDTTNPNQETSDKLKTEREKVNSINEALEKIINDKLNSCLNEFRKITGKDGEGLTLQQCENSLEKAKKEIQDKIKTLADLQACSAEIDKTKEKLKFSYLDEGFPPGYLYLYETKLSSNCASSSNPAYNVKDSREAYGKMIPNAGVKYLLQPESCTFTNDIKSRLKITTDTKTNLLTDKNILTVNEAELILNRCNSNKNLLQNIYKVCVPVIETEEYKNTISEMENQFKTNKPILNLPEECKKIIDNQSCKVYFNDASNTNLASEINLPTDDFTGTNCKTDINENLCQLYINEKGEGIIKFSNIKSNSSGTQYLNDCKDQVDDAVELAYLNSVKAQCDNKDFDWSGLTRANAEIKLKECYESLQKILNIADYQALVDALKKMKKQTTYITLGAQTNTDDIEKFNELHNKINLIRNNCNDIPESHTGNTFIYPNSNDKVLYFSTDDVNNVYEILKRNSDFFNIKPMTDYISKNPPRTTKEKCDAINKSNVTTPTNASGTEFRIRNI